MQETYRTQLSVPWTQLIYIIYSFLDSRYEDNIY